MMEIKIKYHDPELPKLQAIENGDWIDMYASETIEMKAGEFRIIPLGVSIKLPDGYEAHLAPRSSTFKKWGILMVNSVGVIDNSYCGENDVWGFAALAIRPTIVNKGDRIVQFRVMRKMESVEFIEVSHMEDESRGGFGSTGHRGEINVQR